VTAAARSIEATLAPRPFLKWVGGKRQLLPELRKHVPAKFGRYFEPFVGGGALFFDLRARGYEGAATLSDANRHLVQTYVGVGNYVEGVIGRLKKMQYEPAYYATTRARQPDPDRDQAAYIAAWFIYINKTGFNGLWRVNRKGQCNVPFGRYDNPTICDAPTLRACSAALANTSLWGTDFEDPLREARRGDFVYIDPPYAPVSTTANFVGYVEGGFGLSDQTRLRDTAWRLREKGVHVVLSNANVPLVQELYKKFDVRVVEARRAVNSNAAKRGKVEEVIIT